jgi:hypothetical protein
LAAMSAANSPRGSNANGNGDGDAGEDFEGKVNPKRARKSDADMTLDDSEEENECEDETLPKKKRRLGNIAAAKAAQFDTCMRALDAKRHQIDVRLKEASLTLATEKKSIETSALSNETDKKTRALYIKSLSSCLLVGQLWCNLETKLPVKDGDKGAAPTTKETVNQQAESLKQALALAGTDASIERGHFLRGHVTMSAFVSSATEDNITPAALDKHRTVWKRMFTAISQFEASFKKANIEVEKHIKYVANSAERGEQSKQKDAAKRAQSAHAAEMKDRVKKAKGVGVEVPAFFKLDSSCFEKVAELKADRLPQDLNLDVPLIIVESKLVLAWAADASVSQVVINYGARYKKAPGFDTGKTTQPLATKAGKEQTEKLFGDIVDLVKKHIVDISEHAANWMTTSWIFGLASSHFGGGLTPNSAACFKMLMYGSAELYLAPIAELLRGLNLMGIKFKNMVELETQLFALTDVQIKKLKETVSFHIAALKKEQLLYIPTGWICLEKCGQETMIYGVRKSYFFRSAAAVANYTAAKQLLDGDGKGTEKMALILPLLAVGAA